MRTIRTIAAAGALALLLAGCYIGFDGGTGSVGIELPPSRAVSGAGYAFGRIYVINGPTLVPVGGATPYKEFALTSAGTKVTEVSVGPVPAGGGYQVVLVLGNKDDGVDVFVPIEYALSNEFTVYAGQATGVEMELFLSPFVPVDPANTLGRSLRDVVYDGTDLFTATASQLLRAVGASPGDFGAVSFSGTFDVPADRTVNTLSLGAREAAPTVWLNTTRGVLPFTGVGFDDAFDVDSGIDQDSILDSGAFVNGTTVFGYVQFDGGLTGVRDRLGFAPEWLIKVNLSEIVSGKPIYDMAVEDGAQIRGYFATKLGAFRLPESVLDPVEEIDTVQKVIKAAEFFEVEINGTPAVITNLSVAGNYLYVGTPRGAVRVLVSDIGPTVPLVPATFIGGVSDTVWDIQIAGSYAVIATTHFLVYTRNALAPVPTFETPIPLYASSVGQPTGLLLSPDGIVLVTGEFGMAGVDLDP